MRELIRNPIINRLLSSGLPHVTTASEAVETQIQQSTSISKIIKIKPILFYFHEICFTFVLVVNLSRFSLSFFLSRYGTNVSYAIDKTQETEKKRQKFAPRSCRSKSWSDDKEYANTFFICHSLLFWQIVLLSWRFGFVSSLGEIVGSYLRHFRLTTTSMFPQKISESNATLFRISNCFFSFFYL